MKNNNGRSDLVKMAFKEAYKRGVDTIDEGLSEEQVDTLAEDFYKNSEVYLKHLSHWDK